MDRKIETFTFILCDNYYVSYCKQIPALVEYSSESFIEENIV